MSASPDPNRTIQWRWIWPPALAAVAAMLIGALLKLGLNISTLGFDIGGFIGAIVGVAGVFIANHIQIQHALSKDREAQEGAALLVATALRFKFITFSAAINSTAGALVKAVLESTAGQPQVDQLHLQEVQKHAAKYLDRLSGSDLAGLDLALRLEPKKGAALLDRGVYAEQLMRTAFRDRAFAKLDDVQEDLKHLGFYLLGTVLILKPLADRLGPGSVTEGAQSLSDAFVDATRVAEALQRGNLNDPLLLEMAKKIEW